MVTYVRCGELDYYTFTRKNIIIYSTFEEKENITSYNTTIPATLPPSFPQGRPRPEKLKLV